MVAHTQLFFYLVAQEITRLKTADVGNKVLYGIMGLINKCPNINISYLDYYTQSHQIRLFTKVL